MRLTAVAGAASRSRKGPMSNSVVVRARGWRTRAGPGMALGTTGQVVWPATGERGVGGESGCRVAVPLSTSSPPPSVSRFEQRARTYHRPARSGHGGPRTVVSAPRPIQPFLKKLKSRPKIKKIITKVFLNICIGLYPFKIQHRENLNSNVELLFIFRLVAALWCALGVRTVSIFQ